MSNPFFNPFCPTANPWFNILISYDPGCDSTEHRSNHERTAQGSAVYDRVDKMYDSSN